MPILWRYVLQSHLRIFSLSVCTFVAVLIIARFKEIARFTALSGDWLKTGLYTLYQVPAILPIAIPLSALIASLVLFQYLSQSRELTAFRASGLHLLKILWPVLFTAVLLSLCNFAICASLSPYCRREGKTLLYRETSQNPLVLLQRQKLIKIKDAYLDMRIKNDETTKDLILIVPNNSTQQLNLVSAKKLRLCNDELIGNDFSIVSYLNVPHEFDTLIIENQRVMSTSASLLSAVLKKNRSRVDLSDLDFKMLRMETFTPSKKTPSAWIEILKRLSFSLATFSFAFLGAAFGIDEGRRPSRRPLAMALALTLGTLICYLIAKELKGHLMWAAVLFLLPHPLLWLSASLRLQHKHRGRA